MKKQKVLSFITFGLLILCVGLLVFLFCTLVPSLESIPAGVETLGNFIYLFWLIALVLQLISLVSTLRSIPTYRSPHFALSATLTLLCLSCVLYFWDFILLMDIADDYQGYDVSQQWLLLMINMIIQIASAVASLRLSEVREADGGVSAEAITDVPFMTIHQTGAICGIVGVIAVIFSQLFTIPERFSDLWIFYFAVFTLLPFLVTLFSLKGVRTDERQGADSQKSALKTSMILFVALIVLACLDVFLSLPLRLMFWIWFIIFVLLAVYCLLTLRENRTGADLEG